MTNTVMQMTWGKQNALKRTEFFMLDSSVVS